MARFAMRYDSLGTEIEAAGVSLLHGARMAKEEEKGSRYCTSRK